MTGDISNSYYCETCGRTMSGEQFYSSNNLEKYPNDGKFSKCKKCMTMHVDNWNPDTYLWILQEADVPYIPDEWNKLMASYAKDRSKVTGMTIVGRYLSKMKLKQFKDYRWKDNEFLQEMATNRIEQTMKRQGYEAAEIAQAVQKAVFSIPEGDVVEPPPPVAQIEEIDDYFAEQCGVPDQPLDLTDEDRLYLRLKWGKTYKPEEWVKLEQLYTDFCESYDIQSAGHIDTLKLICKTSLKANQLIDMGDIEGYQKMSKVYDSLMKSGKFTAAQNKAESGEFVDSVGELVSLCETQGYIERYYVTEPKDKVDETLVDMKRYTKSLVDGETDIITLIENAIKQNVKEDKAEQEAELSTDIVDDLSIDDVENEIHDQDYEDFNEFIDTEKINQDIKISVEEE